MLLDDVRKTVEGTLGLLTPAKAQQLAKDLMEPGAAKEQIAKTAADLMDWSQSNRERLTSFIRVEITDQMKNVGVASTADLDALKRRVRDLERAAGMTASGRKPARKKSTARSSAKKSSAKKSTAKSSTRATAKRPPASGSGNGNGSGSTGA